MTVGGIRFIPERLLMMMMMMMINWYPKLAYQLSIDMCSETWLLSAQLEGDGKKSYVGSKHFPGAVLTLLNSQARSWENKGWFLRRTGLSQSTSIHTTACPALKREYDDEDTRRRSPRVKGACPVDGSGQLALPKRQRTLGHTLVTAAQQASFDWNW